MHRYSFTIRRDGKEYPDTTGTLLLSEEAAHAYALRIIRELKEAGGHDNPALMMIVKNAAGKTVFSIPFVLA